MNYYRGAKEGDIETRCATAHPIYSTAIQPELGSVNASFFFLW